MSGSAKSLLLSIIILSILIPARAAQGDNPREALKKALRQMIWFNLIYVLALRFIFPRLL